jgi:hypothetical protein
LDQAPGMVETTQERDDALAIVNPRPTPSARIHGLHEAG